MLVSALFIQVNSRQPVVNHRHELRYVIVICVTVRNCKLYNSVVNCGEPAVCNASHCDESLHDTDSPLRNEVLTADQLSPYCRACSDRGVSHYAPSTAYSAVKGVAPNHSNRGTKSGLFGA